MASIKNCFQINRAKNSAVLAILKRTYCAVKKTPSNYLRCKFEMLRRRRTHEFNLIRCKYEKRCTGACTIVI